MRFECHFDRNTTFHTLIEFYTKTQSINYSAFIHNNQSFGKTSDKSNAKQTKTQNIYLKTSYLWSLLHSLLYYSQNILLFRSSKAILRFFISFFAVKLFKTLTTTQFVSDNWLIAELWLQLTTKSTVFVKSERKFRRRSGFSECLLKTIQWVKCFSGQNLNYRFETNIVNNRLMTISLEEIYRIVEK